MNFEILSGWFFSNLSLKIILSNFVFSILAFGYSSVVFLIKNILLELAFPLFKDKLSCLQLRSKETNLLLLILFTSFNSENIFFLTFIISGKFSSNFLSIPSINSLYKLGIFFSLISFLVSESVYKNIGKTFSNSFSPRFSSSSFRSADDSYESSKFWNNILLLFFSSSVFSFGLFLLIYLYESKLSSLLLFSCLFSFLLSICIWLKLFSLLSFPDNLKLTFLFPILFFLFEDISLFSFLFSSEYIQEFLFFPEPNKLIFLSFVSSEFLIGLLLQLKDFTILFDSPLFELTYFKLS